jgi:RimJ/RimL family protein N-acetyltransferase
MSSSRAHGRPMPPALYRDTASCGLESGGMVRPAFDPRPVTLAGTQVVVEPLSLRHAADLLIAGQDDATWSYMPRPGLRTLEDAESMIRQALVETEAGREVAFALVSQSGGKAVGSTRFLDIQRTHRALEIGWTWIGVPWQRTAINTECKLLLLQHAFEGLGANRVTLKTDARNVRSQKAIERIGAAREGLLRRHRVCWDGFVRDTVYYGIVDGEWPDVRARLERTLAARGEGAPRPSSRTSAP